VHSEYFDVWSALSEPNPINRNRSVCGWETIIKTCGVWKILLFKEQEIGHVWWMGGKLGKCQFIFCLMTISKESTVPYSKYMCSG